MDATCDFDQEEARLKAEGVAHHAAAELCGYRCGVVRLWRAVHKAAPELIADVRRAALATVVRSGGEEMRGRSVGGDIAVHGKVVVRAGALVSVLDLIVPREQLDGAFADMPYPVWEACMKIHLSPTGTGVPVVQVGSPAMVLPWSETIMAPLVALAVKLLDGVGAGPIQWYAGEACVGFHAWKCMTSGEKADVRARRPADVREHDEQ